MDVPSTKPTHANERNTALSLLLGIIIWFLHQNIIYALTSLTCRWGWFPGTSGETPNLRIVQTLITIVAALPIAWMIFLSWRNWRYFQTKTPTQNDQVLHDTEKDRRALMAFVTMLLNAMFLIFVLTTLMPILTLNACALSGGGA